jgi:hypothetical protein
MHPVTIENDAIRMEVWPQVGGKISSIIDKADNTELMFTYPTEIPDTPHYDANYADHWHSGWDECFPAIGRGPYPRHPYAQISVPDHGELWGIPVTTAVPAKDGITIVWHGLRFGYRLTRKLYLEASTIHAEYTLVNLAPFEFRFVWASNPLMSLSPQVQFQAGSKSFRLSHQGSEVEINSEFNWPRGEAGEMFDAPNALPAKKVWKIFSVDPISTPFVVAYPDRNRKISMEYRSEDKLAAYWGIWINTGGWAGNRHFAVAPTTGRFDRIDQSVQDDSAGKVPSFGRRSWSMHWTLG